MGSTKRLIVILGLSAAFHAAAGEGAEPLGAPPEVDEATNLFTQDDDNYFLFGGVGEAGTRAEMVRFQLSMKFNLLPRHARWTVFFGFTQKSIWDLWNFGGSSPFYDSNYNPSLFYAFRCTDFLANPEPTPGWKLIHLRAGIDHESNGRDGADSRGWHRAIGVGRVAYYFTSDERMQGGSYERFWHAIFDAKVWAPLVEGRDAAGGGNPDILRYYGWGQYSFELGYDVPVRIRGSEQVHYQRRLGAGVMGRVGSASDRFYLEAWVRYRLPFLRSFAASVMAQYTVGYGETLLRYDQWQGSTVRFGVALDDLLSSDGGEFVSM